MKRLIPISMFILGAMLMASQITTAGGAGAILGAAEMDSFVGATGPCKNPTLVNVGCLDCVQTDTTSYKCTLYQDGMKCDWGTPYDCTMDGSLRCSWDRNIYENQDCLGLPETVEQECLKPTAQGTVCY